MQKMSKIIIGLLSLVLSGELFAQTAGLAWDPVTDQDLASYVIYRGTQTGTYDFNQDVGNVVTTTLTLPSNCVRYYFAAKSKDTAGNLSENYSNEINGLPRVELLTVTPSSLERGRSYNLALGGQNFENGVVSSSSTGLIFELPVIQGCSNATVGVLVASDAPLGTYELEFTRNSDNVFGTKLGAITITTDVTAPPPPDNLRRAEQDNP